MVTFTGEVDVGGVHTNTEDIDCLECKCDLWMSAVISKQCPGQAACPEHASRLPCRPEDWILLHRCACSPAVLGIVGFGDKVLGFKV